METHWPFWQNDPAGQVTLAHGEGGKQPAMHVPSMQVWFIGQLTPVQGSRVGTQLGVHCWPAVQVLAVQGSGWQRPPMQVRGAGQPLAGQG
jgi:hypothetical protein